jgi:peptidoglycan hydrolase-like protein with peptidoglycan-binding domain
MQVGHVLADDGVTGGVRAVGDALCALRPDENHVFCAVRPGQRLSQLRRRWPWPVSGWDNDVLQELAQLDGVFNPSTTRLVQSLRRRAARPVRTRVEVLCATLTRSLVCR